MKNYLYEDRTSVKWWWQNFDLRSDVYNIVAVGRFKTHFLSLKLMQNIIPKQKIVLRLPLKCIVSFMQYKQLKSPILHQIQRVQSLKLRKQNSGQRFNSVSDKCRTDLFDSYLLTLRWMVLNCDLIKVTWIWLIDNNILHT